MASDQRWKWAGIVSAISIGGVLMTDIVANVVGGYISEQIKATWQVPQQAPAATETPAPQAVAVVASIPMNAAPQPEVKMAAVAPKPLPVEQPDAEIVATREPLPLPETEPEVMATPETLPLPAPRALAVSGTVEQVIDTGTLKIEGETVVLAGIAGLGSPYRDQLAKFIQEQGSQIRCSPSGERHICFVKNVDLALAALTNGAARLAAGATAQYQKAEADARRNRRGVFQ
jgi:endonuclease YncB( thermonuclease family)